MLNAVSTADTRVNNPKAINNAPTDSHRTTKIASRPANGNPILAICAAKPHELQATRPLIKGNSQVNFFHPKTIRSNAAAERRTSKP